MATIGNANFDNRLAATANLWLKNEFENLFIRNNALFVRLRQQNNVKIGGIKMVEPIMFPAAGGNTAIGVSSAYTAITQTATAQNTAAEFVPAEYLMPISVEEYDLDMQVAETEKVNWVQGILQINIEKLLVAIEADLWGAEETANNNGSSRTKLASLRQFLNAGTAGTVTAGVEPAELAEQLGNRGVCSTTSATLITSVGGIDRATTGGGYWCTPILNTSQAMGFLAMQNLLSATRNGARHADLIILHKDMFDKLANLAANQGGNGGQYYQGSKLGDLGFEALRFGGADIITDDRCPTKSYLNGTTTAYGYNAFAINTKYLNLRAKTMKPQIRPVDDARAIKVWTARMVLQMTSGHLGRVHGRHVYLA